MKRMTITTLGAATFQSPLATGDADEMLVPADIQWLNGMPPDNLMLFKKSGPRAKLFFDPLATRAAIVTCGRLCPGLNNVIRSVTRELRQGEPSPSLLQGRVRRGRDDWAGEGQMNLFSRMVANTLEESTKHKSGQFAQQRVQPGRPDFSQVRYPLACPSTSGCRQPAKRCPVSY